jgi:hypothetical protein
MAALLEELWAECVQVHGSRQLTPFQKSKLDLVSEDVWKSIQDSLDGVFIDAGGAQEPDDERLPARVEKLEEQLGRLVDEINDIRHEFPPAAADRVTEELRRQAPIAPTATGRPKPADGETENASAPGDSGPSATKPTPVDELVMENFKENVEALAKLVAQAQEKIPATAAKAHSTSEVLAQHSQRPPVKLEQVLTQETERELGERKRAAADTAAPARGGKSAKVAPGADVHGVF